MKVTPITIPTSRIEIGPAGNYLSIPRDGLPLLLPILNVGDGIHRNVNVTKFYKLKKDEQCAVLLRSHDAGSHEKPLWKPDSVSEEFYEEASFFIKHRITMGHVEAINRMPESQELRAFVHAYASAGLDLLRLFCEPTDLFDSRGFQASWLHYDYETDQYVISLKAGSHKQVCGYTGFETEIRFDSEGRFVKQSIWE